MGRLLPAQGHPRAADDLRRGRCRLPLLRATIETNVEHQRRLVERVAADCPRAGADGSLHGVRLALLGLTFKAGTADLRDSPALAIARLLRSAAPNSPPTTRHLRAPARTSATCSPSSTTRWTPWPGGRRRGAHGVAAVARHRLGGRRGAARHPTVHDFRNLLDPDRLGPSDCAGRASAARRRSRAAPEPGVPEPGHV
ncbi:hypothetical protein NKH77_32145 [Streptomyces sp. M19]